MASSYSYDPVGALDTGAELVAETKRMETLISNLETAAQRFIAANEGQSINGYSHAQTTWNQGHTEMELALGKGVQALDRINAEYLHGDARATAEFMG